MRVFKTYVFKTEAEAVKWREAAAKCEFGLLVVYPVIFVPFRTFEESMVAEAAEQLLVERDRRRSIERRERRKALLELLFLVGFPTGTHVVVQVLFGKR